MIVAAAHRHGELIRQVQRVGEVKAAVGVLRQQVARRELIAFVRSVVDAADEDARAGRQRTPAVSRRVRSLSCSSSCRGHMFRHSIPALADRYRVIAPSAAPARSEFKYTFDNFAKLVDGLTQKLGVSRYALYVMDYGAPVGFRLAATIPDRVTALVVQNGNAYTEGLQKFWEPIQKYWVSGARRTARLFAG